MQIFLNGFAFVTEVSIEVVGSGDESNVLVRKVDKREIQTDEEAEVSVEVDTGNQRTTRSVSLSYNQLFFSQITSN